jgi:6-phosphofructokinase 1
VEVIGLRRGWRALINIRLDGAEGAAAAAGSAVGSNREWMTPLDRAATRTIHRSGGTVLRSSRVNPALLLPKQLPPHLADLRPPAGSRTLDLTAVAVRTIEHLGLDGLVAIGGDGTLSFARRLHHEGVPVVAVPKTMDNDVYGTDYCVGFSTAVTRAVRYINDLRTVAGSHERFLVVELFGRESGETALIASYLAGTDRALIAEVPFDLERLVELMASDRESNPSRYAVVAVSEGARPVGGEMEQAGEPDAIGHRRLGGIGRRVSEALERRGGDAAIYQRLGYLMRSGPPDSLDLLVADNYGNLAADLLLSGATGKMCAILGGRYRAIPIETLGEGVRRVDVDRFYDVEQYRPKVVRIEGLPMFLH